MSIFRIVKIQKFIFKTLEVQLSIRANLEGLDVFFPYGLIIEKSFAKNQTGNIESNPNRFDNNNSVIILQ